MSDLAFTIMLIGLFLLLALGLRGVQRLLDLEHTGPADNDHG